MRYYDELPHKARIAFRNAVGAARDGQAEAIEAFAAIGLGLPVVAATHFADLFDKAAYGHGANISPATQQAAIYLFGEESVGVATSLCDDVHAETEHLAGAREIRICMRIADGTCTAADVEWIRARAEALSDDQILEMQPFAGDESDSKELLRRVVKGRKPHTCHWTRETIAPGERHLVIKEVCGGEFVETRHSLLAAYLDVRGEDPGLAAHLAPREPQEAAA